jgi:glycosyltransferase involved in cell wall biosynthesis
MISVITVVYNGEKTIGRTLESVCSQTLLPLEYIVIDGLSTDSTAEIVQSYCSKYPFIKFISEKDSGIYNAMNKGINLAKGKLIGIINSDDWYENQALEKMWSLYQTNGDGVYYGFMRLIKEGKEYTIERTHSDFLNYKMIQHPTCFISKEIYTKYGTFDEQFRSAADYDLMLRLKRSNVNFIMSDAIIANFSLGGISGSIKGMLENLAIRKKFGIISKNSYLYKHNELKIKEILKRITKY